MRCIRDVSLSLCGYSVVDCDDDDGRGTRTGDHLFRMCSQSDSDMVLIEEQTAVSVCTALDMNIQNFEEAGKGHGLRVCARHWVMRRTSMAEARAPTHG